ncbi:ABC transporter permease [Ciceribacter sp. L1K23]|uniref:ABC transporter permease n=1 Tax=Ciceribacter sp. L1K23 TaxID=2820276 RepID=UPI001B81774F|nr:ABC transporter permease [Ciceribacter sp. L1K23]MBR0554121.1 ABC transporter permease [Ciceribacter sp. L1K23]
MHWITHIRIVAALLIREMSTRFGSRPGGYIWALVDPAAHIALLTMLFRVIAKVPALGTSFPLFFATGYIAFQFYQASATYVSSALSANRALLNYPSVAPVDTLIARLVLQIATTAFVGVLVIGAISHGLKTPLTLNWAAIFEAIFAAAFLALGGALANTVLFLKWPFYESIYGIIMRPLMLLSGVFFLPDSIPHPYQDVLLLNPVVHIVILFRKGFYPEYRGEALSLEYLYGFSGILLLLGTALFTASSRLLRNE